MQTLFLTILDMSIMASVIILFVLILRLLLECMPKVFSYVLWIVVLFRLLCPFKIESDMSIIPYSFSEVPQSIALEEGDNVSFVETMSSTYEAIGDAFNGGLEILQVKTNSEQLGNNGYVPAFHAEVWLLFFGYVWLIGVVVMLVIGIGKGIKFRHSLEGALEEKVLKENLNNTIYLLQNNIKILHRNYKIYLSDNVDSPFVMGLFVPKIYLPSNVSEEERTYLLLHEQYHIRRGDHWVKWLYFLALCLHWFNPFVWLAFSLAGKDMEMSCDEAVIKKLGEESRTEYAQLLLNFSVGKHSFVGTPLAFGEGDVKSRIKNLLSLKKQKVWMISIVGFLLVLFIILFLLSPTVKQTEVMGANYGIAEILYERPIPPEIQFPTAEYYCITADYHLYDREDETYDWNYIGALENYHRIVTNQKELEGYFDEKVKIANVTDCYIVRGERNIFYLVMQTKKGETLLGIGLEDTAERYDEHSDDTFLFALYRLGNLFRESSVNGNFFSRSLKHSVGKYVDSFAYYFNENDFPDYMIVGFLADDSEASFSNKKDAGFAVFQIGKNKRSYRLLEYYYYENASQSKNGIYACPDVAIVDKDGILTDKTGYDVILINNYTNNDVFHDIDEDDVAKMELILHYPDGSEKKLTYSIQGKREMILVHWDDTKEADSTSWHFYTKDGNEIDPP